MLPFTFIFRSYFEQFEPYFSKHGTLRSFAIGDNIPYTVNGAPAAYFSRHGGGARYSIINELGIDSTLFYFSDYSVYPLSCFTDTFTFDDSTCITCTGDLEAYAVPRHIVRELLASDPAFARASLSYISQITNTLISQKRLDSYQNAHISLCAYLYIWIEQSRASHNYYINRTQEQIATWCGISRVHLSRVLKTLKDAGVIQLRRGHIEVWDRDKLLKYCESLGIFL